MKRVSMVVAAVGMCAPSALAFFADPGFESYDVAAGQAVFDNSGPWAFENNGRVVEPYTNGNIGSPPDTWSAVFAPHGGEQYACTYAGADTITQSVMLAPGSYTVSVWAAAPSGTVTISGNTLTLVTGGFEFTLDGSPISLVNALDPDTGWTLFSATFAIDTPGSYDVGVHNPVIAPYFIYFDDFALVPAPGIGMAGALAGVALGRRRRRE